MKALAPKMWGWCRLGPPCALRSPRASPRRGFLQQPRCHQRPGAPAGLRAALRGRSQQSPAPGHHHQPAVPGCPRRDGRPGGSLPPAVSAPRHCHQRPHHVPRDLAVRRGVQKGSPKGSSPPPPRLYAFVNERLFSKPTYASFIRLLDNYQRATGREEEVTAEELREQDTFLREVMKTELMKKLFAFLHQKSECGAWEERGRRVSLPQLLFPCLPPRSALPADRYGSEQEFLEDLKEMWFGLYSRGNGEKDSSGFEHVFSGEIKKGQVSGFHNWIRFYLLEKQGLVNYYSHNYNGPWDSYPDVLGLQFSWDGFYKEVGSAFIGCSPEFEFGVYTLCFIARPGRACHLSLGGHSISIQTYTWTKSTYGPGKKYIATAYVISP
uniref:Uridylate-specific endoribonuclease n=1 Tax=Cairina moschata TaxID=8855 RepID=A0A8C3CWR5_CAIMO